MISKELSEAAVEVNCILRNSTPQIIHKIPLKFLKFLKRIESPTYKFEYDKSKKLNEQNLKPETRNLIALIYKKYICKEDEKKVLIKEYQEYINQIEIERRENYNPNKIFDNINYKENEHEIGDMNSKAIQVVENQKDNIWQRIIKILKHRIFKNLL